MTKKDKVRLARGIRKLREAMGITQAEFADRLGIEVITVSRWERQCHVPKQKIVIKTIKRWASAHDVELPI